MKKIECKNCLCWERTSSHFETNQIGECHRKSPNQSTINLNVWIPLTNIDDYCFEGVEKDEEYD